MLGTGPAEAKQLLFPFVALGNEGQGLIGSAAQRQNRRLFCYFH